MVVSSQTNVFLEGLSRYLTAEQLTRIQSKRIGLGGAGGLGSNVAMILARTGFTHFEIIDQDVIDPSNLNRQQYSHHDIGQPKATTTQEKLLAINPELDITVHHAAWSPLEGRRYFKGCDFIIEAFDRADVKHQFVDYYHDKAEVIVSGVGMAGLLEKKPMSVRKIGNIYICGDASTDTACGHPPMAPRVVKCAAMMAEVVLDLTLGVPVHLH